MQEHMTATVFDGATPVATGVRIRLETYGKKGTGDFLFPREGGVGLGKKYRVESDDGWVGTIMITDIQAGSDQPTVAKFDTTGPFGRSR